MGTRNRPSNAGMTKQELEELSEFRYQLRRFLHFFEKIVHAEGITPLQYMLLLHVKGFPNRDWATVGELAERLQASPNGIVALVSRCEAAGFVIRKPSAHDRRQVEVHLFARERASRSSRSCTSRRSSRLAGRSGIVRNLRKHHGTRRPRPGQRTERPRPPTDGCRNSPRRGGTRASFQNSLKTTPPITVVIASTAIVTGNTAPDPARF